MTSLFLAGLVAVIAGAMATRAIPIVARLAMAVRAVDYPGTRRVQEEAIPRIGGLAIVVGAVAGVGLTSGSWWQWHEDFTLTEFVAMVLGAGLIFAIGLADDIIGLSPVQRFLVQVAAALVVVYSGVSIASLAVPYFGEIQLGIWGSLVMVVWIVGVTNAFNLLDGLDGLACGVSAILALNLLVLGWIHGSLLTVMLMSAILGACLGFLRRNWAPARIYMGDSGALTLGFLFAVMSLQVPAKGPVSILIPVLSLGLPVIDTLLVMIVRFFERPEHSFAVRFGRMFKADRNHLHHVLSRTGLSQNQCVLLIYFVSACFCGIALTVALTGSIGMGYILVLAEVVIIFVMRNSDGRWISRAFSNFKVRTQAGTPTISGKTQVQMKYAQRN